MTNKPKGLALATSLVHRVCEISGRDDFIERLRIAFRENGIVKAVRNHDDGQIFSWFAEVISYQGISDRAAEKYLEEHGRVEQADIRSGLDRTGLCPKLRGYWTFHGCGYRKLKARCNTATAFRTCPLPRHDLRNGNLNQATYSLHFFMRDLAEGDLVRWMDRQLEAADTGALVDRGEKLATSLVEPLRHVHGISDKILNMALADLLLAGAPQKDRWVSAGASMTAVDSLVHNWLHRSGCLRALNAEHPYGPRCYGDNGCLRAIRAVAHRIDTREFNISYPKYFPRFIQHAIWAFCAEQELDQCNGRRINDRHRCDQVDCSLYGRCQRIALTP